MLELLLALIRQLAEKYADEALEKALALLERAIAGEASDAEIMAFLRERQEGDPR